MKKYTIKNIFLNLLYNNLIINELKVQIVTGFENRIVSFSSVGIFNSHKALNIR